MQKKESKIADLILSNIAEESVLSYKAREKLSDSDFCGPDRSYPAHDAAHARNCLARANQNKAKLGAMYSKIVACCSRRLKKFGGEPSEESMEDPVVAWYKKQKLNNGA